MHLPITAQRQFAACSLLLLFALGLPGMAHGALSQVAALTADNPQSQRFGFAVAVDGDTLVIGAPHEDTGGVANGGAVYIFTRDARGWDKWRLVKKLTLFDPDPGNFFGSAVAVSGDIAVVGAPGEDRYGSTDIGAIYIYDRNRGGNNNWGLVKHEFRQFSYHAGDLFGCSVAIDNSIIVAGAYGEDTSAGVNAGAAYVFSRDYGGVDNWGMIKKLAPSFGDTQDSFGWSVAAGGDTVVVGSPAASGAMVADSGAAFVFARDQGGIDNWGQVKWISLGLFYAHTGDWFGVSVSLKDDLLVIGANQVDIAGTDAGAAYVYYRNQGGNDNWGLVKRLTAADASASDFFGDAVSVAANSIMVGAPYHDIGDIADGGAAYVFSRNTGGRDNWGQADKLYPTPAESEAGACFGFSVSMSDAALVAGAYLKDTAAADSGAAYVFAHRFPWLLFYPAFLDAKKF